MSIGLDLHAYSQHVAPTELAHWSISVRIDWKQLSKVSDINLWKSLATATGLEGFKSLYYLMKARSVDSLVNLAMETEGHL